MNIVIFGASGMVGTGVLLECLDDPEVRKVVVVGRQRVGMTHPKLVDIIHRDFTDFGPIADRLTGLDACFWCLGVSSTGMSEADYRRVTVDFTIAATSVLLARNPGLRMCFVSGQGTDSTERGRVMWARVKGAAENALLAMPFGALTIFRPGFIQPRRGATSKTRSYRVAYAVMWPLQPLIKLVFGKRVTNTVAIGRAMLQAARVGAGKQILTNAGINELAAGYSRPTTAAT